MIKSMEEIFENEVEIQKQKKEFVDDLYDFMIQNATATDIGMIVSSTMGKNELNDTVNNFMDGKTLADGYAVVLSLFLLMCSMHKEDEDMEDNEWFYNCIQLLCNVRSFYEDNKRFKFWDM